MRRGTGYKKPARPCKACPFNYTNTVLAAKQSALNSSLFKNTIVKDQAKKFHAWLDMVVAGLQQFGIVEDQIILKRVKVSGVSVEKLCKVMSTWTAGVEE